MRIAHRCDHLQELVVHLGINVRCLGSIYPPKAQLKAPPQSLRRLSLLVLGKEHWANARLIDEGIALSGYNIHEGEV